MTTYAACSSFSFYSCKQYSHTLCSEQVHALRDQIRVSMEIEEGTWTQEIGLEVVQVCDCRGRTLLVERPCMTCSLAIA